jgi:iron complex outermembrane receptor protein
VVPGGGTCFKFDGGNGGNAKLDPFRASQFNINRGRTIFRWCNGLFSAGYFYKAVDNFVTTSNSQACIADGTIGGCTVGNIASLTNGGTGKIYGVELTAQYAFGNGFGFQANVTKSNSESSQNNAIDKNVAIPGVPKTAFNVIGYFERAGFSGRLAYAWRDKAVNSSSVGSSFSFQDITGTFRRPTRSTRRHTGSLDGQVGYDFGPHLGVWCCRRSICPTKSSTRTCNGRTSRSPTTIRGAACSSA